MSLRSLELLHPPLARWRSVRGCAPRHRVRRRQGWYTYAICVYSMYPCLKLQFSRSPLSTCLSLHTDLVMLYRSLWSLCLFTHPYSTAPLLGLPCKPYARTHIMAVFVNSPT